MEHMGVAGSALVQRSVSVGHYATTQEGASLGFNLASLFCFGMLRPCNVEALGFAVMGIHVGKRRLGICVALVVGLN